MIDAEPSHASGPVTNGHDDCLDVVVAGAGFGGLAMAHELTKASGTNFLLLEKGPRIGGTWRDNAYPGAACDIPSHLYSLSFAPNPDWSRMFASQPEILRYMEGIVDLLGIRDRIRLNSEIKRAVWCRDRALWRVELTTGSFLWTRVLVTAMGVLHHPHFPNIAGREAFSGRMLHSARWDHELDPGGLRIAVIGSGASAIQLVPQLAKTAAKVTIFQRTPPWIAPKFDRALSEERRSAFRRSRYARLKFRAELWLAHERRAVGFTSQDPKVLARTEALCRDHLERQVKDPVLRARLTPDYTVGCKRLLISNDWYPTLQQPNVNLVSNGVAAIEAEGVRDASGVLHEADVIVFGTGFDAQGALTRCEIVGSEGRTLQSLWAEEGKGAYLGTLVSGFPNLFLMTGPHAGSGHTSQLFMLEAQAHFIGLAIKKLRRAHARTIEVKRAAQERFEAEMSRRLAKSVWHAGGCQSWYLDERGRNTVLWPSLSLDFWWRTRFLRPGHLEFRS